MQPLIREFRVAPLGYSFVGFGVANGLGILALECISEPDPQKTITRAGLAIGLVAAYAFSGGRLVKRQHALHDRLESSIERHGYDERVFAVTTDEWCNRQTARVVCEAAGVLPQYEQLCNERQETATHAYVPHI